MSASRSTLSRSRPTGSRGRDTRKLRPLTQKQTRKQNKKKQKTDLQTTSTETEWRRKNKAPAAASHGANGRDDRLASNRSTRLGGAAAAHEQCTQSIAPGPDATISTGPLYPQQHVPRYCCSGSIVRLHDPPSQLAHPLRHLSSTPLSLNQ